MIQAVERTLAACREYPRGMIRRLIHPTMPEFLGELIITGILGMSASAGVEILVGTIVLAAASVGLNMAMRAIMGVPKMPHFSDQQRGFQTTMRIPAAPHRIIYGFRRVGGVITYIDTRGANNNYLDLVITLTGHECQSIGNVYFDGELVTLDSSGDGTGPYAGLLHVEKKVGSAGEVAFPGLVSNSGGNWTSEHLQEGCASVYVWLKWDEKAYPNGIPNITFDVQGRKVLDPRPPGATVHWTDNWALCVADYLTADFGLNVPATKMDDAATIAAANLSDEVVTSTPGNGGFEVESTSGDLAEGWYVAASDDYISLLEIGGFQRSGTRCLLIGDNGTAVSIAAGTTKSGTVESRFHLPMGDGDSVSFKGYIRTDKNVDNPAGIQLGAYLILRTYYTDATTDDHYSVITAVNGGYQEVGENFTVSVPGGKTINYTAILLVSVVSNPTGSPITTPTGYMWHSRFDDISVSVNGVQVMGAGTVKRYTCNGVLELGQGYESDINDLLTAGSGYLVPAGRYQILGGAYRTPFMTLTDDDCRGPMTYSPLRSTRELCNAVKGLYVSPDNNWTDSDFPPYFDATAVAADGGKEYWDDIKLPFTTAPAEATRHAKIHEKRLRNQGTLTYKAKIKAWRLTPGDTVQITHPRFSWTNKVFEVLEVKLVVDEPKGSGQSPVYGVDLLLRETSSSIYDWNPAVDEGTTLASKALTMPTRKALSSTWMVPNAPTNQGNFAVVDSIDAGSTATIQVHGAGGVGTSYTRRIGGADVTRPAGTVTGKAYDTYYYVVFDGTSYLAFTAYSDVLVDDYEFVGHPKTCLSGGGGGSSGGGGGGGGQGGCVEVGTEVIEPEGSTQEILPCDDWVEMAFPDPYEITAICMPPDDDEGDEEGGHQGRIHDPDRDRSRLRMHPDTMVKVWKKASELTPEDRIGVDGGRWQTGARTKRVTKQSQKVKRTCPGGEYSARCGEHWVELHNVKIMG